MTNKTLSKQTVRYDFCPTHNLNRHMSGRYRTLDEARACVDELEGKGVFCVVRIVRTETIEVLELRGKEREVPF